MEKEKVKEQILYAGCFVTIYEEFKQSACAELKRFCRVEEKIIDGKKVEGIFHPKYGYCYTDTKSPLFVPKEGIKYFDFREMKYGHDTEEEKNFEDHVCKSFRFSKDSKPIKDLSIFKALESMGMISNEDFNYLIQCFKIRNELVHQLYLYLCGRKEFTCDLKASTKKLINISAKASENWIKTIENNEAGDLLDKDIEDREYFNGYDLFCSIIDHYIFD